MRTAIGLLCLLACPGPARAEDALQPLREHLGLSPALVVVVCEGNEQDQAALTEAIETTSWKLFCHVGSGLNAVRAWARSEGLLGQRVSVIGGPAAPLWLAGDIADAVWVMPDARDRPALDEILRVLHAGGLAVTPDQTFVKPAVPGTDQWRHPYHGPDNNVVSQDTVARLPGELRFQTHPMFAAMPNQSLFAGGRIFFFTGHIAFHEREEPLLNKLTVLNAYNGLTLWSRPLDPRYVVHNFSKVATDSEIVYAEGDSLLVLDAATGQDLGKHAVPAECAAAGDTDWKWVAEQDGILWAAFGPPDGQVAPHRQRRQMGHWPWDVANAQYRVIVENFGVAHTLCAFRYPSMQRVWSVTEPEAFDVRALCMQGGRILQLAPQKYVAARDALSGEQLWRHTPETESDALRAIGAALKRQGWGLGWATFCCARASDDVACIAGPPFKKSVCIDLRNGQLLWSSDNESPHPFFLGDSLYVMPRVANPAAVCRRVDPHSGQVLDEFQLGVIGSCTRLTVTPTQFYYRPGGGEGRTVYFDITARALANYEGVVRPGCFDGAVPANGRLYWMPLACDCWQVHGTFSMAPRTPMPSASGDASLSNWASPSTTEPATDRDWPLFRADASGSATVNTKIPRSADIVWQRLLPGQGLTAPISVGGRVYVGSSDGSVWALHAADGQPLWNMYSHAAIVHPPAYWNGTVVCGSCDGLLYAVDAVTGRTLGSTQIAPEKRFVNIMDRLMSVWPVGGGVLVSGDGVVYTAAGSTAADGTVVAALNASTGQYRWRQTYTLDRKEPQFSFGVQSNLLLRGDSLLINGGAPVGIVTLDTATGQQAKVVAKLDAGSEMFLEPDGTPFCTGPELYCNESARTTIFKRHQGRAYFATAGRHIALVAGRLFCAEDTTTLDAIVDKMNSDPKAGGQRVVSEPWDVMRVPVPETVIWASSTADIRGVAVGADGLVVLHEDTVEAFDADGTSLWHVPVPAAPTRWGIALTPDRCVVTLVDGQVIMLGPPPAS